MVEQEIMIWQPVCFDPAWESTTTLNLDNIVPAWYSKRAELQENPVEYERFMSQLKRQHAIETGILERLYDLKQGITETFVKEGFIEEYLQQGDTNIGATQLIGFLTDHSNAIDFVLDVVKNTRAFTRGFILELHQLITSHQETTEAIDSLGRVAQIPLLKGCFKIHENSPKRSDGVLVRYCPPIQVDSEVDHLLEIFDNLECSNLHPVKKAAWFHHAFTQIHPFQDGNGRMARLLSSLILLKSNLFPLTVLRGEKKRYIDSLEKADKGEYQPLVDLFCNIQIRQVELALNWSVRAEASYEEVLDHFSSRIVEWKHQQAEQRSKMIEKNRADIFGLSSEILDSIKKDLDIKLKGYMEIRAEFAQPASRTEHYYTHQIGEYAKQHQYYFNPTLPRGWYRISFILSPTKFYQLIVSVHHFGTGDNALALGAFLEYGVDGDGRNTGSRTVRSSARKGRNNKSLLIAIPLDIRPLTISIEIPVKELKQSIESYLKNVMTIALAHISSELA